MPRQEEVDALLGKELFLFKESEDLETEKPFSGLGVDVGNRAPAPLTVPCSARSDSVNANLIRLTLIPWPYGQKTQPNCKCVPLKNI